MDLVYIVGAGSYWDNNELRYSLRSLRKHGKNIDNVFIVGNCPDWCKGVAHIPCKDPYNEKWHNAWHKIKYACEVIKRPFVLMNDDFFLLKETDFDKPLLYHNGTIPDLLRWYDLSRSAYARVQQKTAQFLDLCGMSQYNFAVHFPITIYPDVMQPYFDDVARSMGSRHGLSFRNFYGNALLSVEKRTKIKQLKDLKLNDMVDRAQFDSMTAGYPFFSISDKFIQGVGLEIMPDLYPPTKHNIFYEC